MATSPARRTDLDLLRIIVCAAVILAHALLIFAAEPRYHLKSAQVWPVASVIYEALRISTLAIFFVLAGWSAVTSLRRRQWDRYLRDRAKRVLLPLVAGMLLLGPVIKWIELTQGRELGLRGLRMVPPLQQSFLEFLPRYLSQSKLMTWSHLWFLAYLFLISVALLPLLQKLAQRVPIYKIPGRAFAWLPAGLLVGIILGTGGYWPFLPNLVQDWENFFYFTGCFLIGGMLAAWPGFEARLRAEAPWLALLALAGLVIVLIAGESPLGRIGVGLCAWGFIGAALGIAGRHPPAASPRFNWLSEATMPVYVLHHIPVLLLGLWLLPLAWPPLAKVLLISLGATAISLLAYRFLVQPWPLPRWLIGMNARPRA